MDICVISLAIEREEKMMLAIVVGIALFCLELVFGIFSAITFHIGGSILILIIIGMIAGCPKDGMRSAFVTLILMIPVGLMVWTRVGFPYPMPDNPITAVWALIGILVYRSLMFDQDNSVGFAIAQLMFLLVSPLLYVAGCLFGALGGNLGSRFWSLFEKKYPERRPPSSSQDYPASSDGW